MLGIVTTKSGKLESKDELKRRIDEAAKYAPLDQLCISGQCGFASTEEGNMLTEDEQWAKLRIASSRSPTRCGANRLFHISSSAAGVDPAIHAAVVSVMRPPGQRLGA